MADTLPRKFTFRSEVGFDVAQVPDIAAAFGQKSIHYRAHVTHTIGSAAAEAPLRQKVAELIAAGQGEVTAILVP